jgi:uncharacterized protein
MPVVTEHDPARQQYRLVDGDSLLAVADYRLDEDGCVAVFHHTYTPVQHRGRGHAAELISKALDDVRASGRSVVATCWYVDEFIDQHPQYADLRLTSRDARVVR